MNLTPEAIAYLTAMGLPIRPAPSSDHPEIPEGQYPVVSVMAPAGQEATLLAADGVDPTLLDSPTPPVGGEARRFLAQLKMAGLITAWHAYVDDVGTTWVNLQLDGPQAAEWYVWLDWTAKSRSTTANPTGADFA